MKLWRRRLGLTQEQLGTRIGVTQVYISMIEKGKIEGLTILIVKKLAKVFNVTPVEMLALLMS